MRKQILEFLSRDLSDGFLWLRIKLPLRLRSFQRSLTKALIVAGLLVTWIAPSANASSIYWANTGPTGTAGSIAQANLDGTGVNNSFITGVAGPWGVAVDGSHIYWGNQFGIAGAIGRANLDGTDVNKNFIFITGVDQTAGIAVDGHSSTGRTMARTRRTPVAAFVRSLVRTSTALA
jgi:hypothetical protein